MPIHNIPLDEQPVEGIGEETKLPQVEVPVDPEVAETFKVGDKVEVTLNGTVKSVTKKEGEQRSLGIDVEQVSIYIDDGLFKDIIEDDD